MLILCFSKYVKHKSQHHGNKGYLFQILDIFVIHLCLQFCSSWSLRCQKTYRDKQQLIQSEICFNSLVSIFRALILIYSKFIVFIVLEMFGIFPVLPFCCPEKLRYIHQYQKLLLHLVFSNVSIFILSNQVKYH